MKSTRLVWVVALFIACSARIALAQEATAPSTSSHVVAGEVEKVSADGKEITVKTVDGTEKVFKVTGKTTVDGAKDVALATKEGSHVVVHYTAKGGEETATGLEDAGKGTWKVTEGTVTKIGEGGKDVTIKLADGTEKTYHVGKEATVDAGHGMVDAGKYTGKAGDKIAVYTMVDPTKEVARLFKKL